MQNQCKMTFRAAAGAISLAAAYFWLFSAYGIAALMNNSLPRQGKGVPFQYLFFVLIGMGVLLLAPLFALVALSGKCGAVGGFAAKWSALGLTIVGVLLLPAWGFVPWWVGGAAVAALIVGTLAARAAPTPKLTVGITVVALAVSGLVADVCIAEAPWHVSTRWSRWWTDADNICVDPHRPCIVYLTLAGDLANSIHVNYHTATQQRSVAYVTRLEDGVTVPVGGTSALLRIERERWVHSVLVKGLRPGTRYRIEAGRVPAAPITFKTAPAGQNASISFVAGGDVGTTPTAVKMSAMVGTLTPAPAFAIVGGDIAYANNFPSCYRVWDKWLKMYERWMVNAEGDAIPIVAAIGNHEAQEEKWGSFISKRSVNFYFDIFPRWNASFHAHRIGAAASVMILDSGHVVPHAAQVPWIAQHYVPGAANVVAYHSPLYSPQDIYACDPTKVQRTYRRPRNAWQGVFAKHRFAAIFEHHTHLLKQSSEIDGNVFLGGGAWGVDPTRRWTTCRNGGHGALIRYAALRNHIWHATVGRNGSVFSAVDLGGTVITRVRR